MNLKENEYLVGDAVIEISEHESYYGMNREPEYFDLKLTIRDGEKEIVIVGNPGKKRSTRTRGRTSANSTLTDAVSELAGRAAESLETRATTSGS